MSYSNKTIQSYYDIKERFDKGLPIDTRSLIDSGILNYSAIITCLKRLGFLRKIKNGVFDLKNLSHIELMALSDEYFKYKEERNYMNKKQKEKQKEKESTIEEQEENDFDTHFNLKRVSVLEMKLNISDYSDEEILAELKKRGYEGALYVVKKQKINL